MKERWRRLGRRPLLTAVGLLLTAGYLGFIGYIAYREREVLVTHLLRADARQLLVVTAWYLVDLAIYIVGWAAIMAQMGGRLSLLRHARIFCLANAAKRLPGTLWYVGGRAALYGQAGIPLRVVVTASAIELALTWLSGLALAIPFLMASFPAQRWLWLGAGGLLLAVLLNPWSLRWVLRRATHGDEASSLALARVYAWLLIYCAGWAVGGFLVFALLTVYQPVALQHLPHVIGGWALSGVASLLTFFLPSGFGVTEATLTVLLSRLVPAGVAVLTAISVRLAGTLLDAVLGGAAYLLELADKRS